MALKRPPAPPGALRGDPPNQVFNYLFIGSAANAANKQELVALGITHILNVKESFFAAPPSGFEFLHVAMSDYGNQNIHEVLPSCFEFIKSAKEKEGKVLVHCRGGVNRSATVVLAWMMNAEKMPLKEAWHHLRSRRSVVSPHEQYVAQLKLYEKDLFGSITLTEEDTGMSAQAKMRQFMLLGKKALAEGQNPAVPSSASTADLLKPNRCGPPPRLGRNPPSASTGNLILNRESVSQPSPQEIQQLSHISEAIEVASKDSPCETDSVSASVDSSSRKKKKSGKSKHRHHGRSSSNLSNSGNSQASEKSVNEASDSGSHSARRDSRKKEKPQKKKSSSLSTSDSSTSMNRSRSPSIQDSETTSQHSQTSSKKSKLPAVEEDTTPTGSPKKPRKRSSRSSATPSEPSTAGSGSEPVESASEIPVSKSKRKVRSETTNARLESSPALPEEGIKPEDVKETPSSPRTSKLAHIFSGIFGRSKKKDSGKAAPVVDAPPVAEIVDDKVLTSSEEKEKKLRTKKGSRRDKAASRMVHSSSFSISADTSTSTSSSKHRMSQLSLSESASNKFAVSDVAKSDKSNHPTLKPIQDRHSTGARSSSSTSSSGT